MFGYNANKRITIMGKYEKAFNEVNVLMSEILDNLNITLEETDLFPT